MEDSPNSPSQLHYCRMSSLWSVGVGKGVIRYLCFYFYECIILYHICERCERIRRERKTVTSPLCKNREGHRSTPPATILICPIIRRLAPISHSTLFMLIALYVVITMNKVPPVFDKPIGLSNQPQHNSLYSTFDNNAYAIGSGMGRALSNRAGAID